MASPSRLEHLAQQISSTTNILNKFLSSKGLPEPSFAKDAPLNFPPAPEEIQIARRNLREASKELYDLVTGPSEHLRWLACNVVASPRRQAGQSLTIWEC